MNNFNNKMKLLIVNNQKINIIKIIKIKMKNFNNKMKILILNKM